MASTTPLGFLPLFHLYSTILDPIPCPPSLGSGSEHDATVSLGRRVLWLRLLVTGYSFASSAVSRVPTRALSSLHPHLYSRPHFLSHPAPVVASIPLILLTPELVVCLCVCICSILRNRAIRPCRLSRSMPLALILPRVCVCVCVCVCVFIKLHITTQSGPVILVILCHSH